MNAQLSSTDSGMAVLLFGPHFLSFDEHSFARLRATLLNKAGNQWIMQTLKELPSHWEFLSQAFPGFEIVPGVKLLRELNDWVENGTLTESSLPLPNVLLTPLVVITQLTQYSGYIDTTHTAQSYSKDGGDRNEINISFRKTSEAVGFCTGLLSALVVASSSNKAQFETYGANAIRLAMLIGGLVDSQDRLVGANGGESKSFSAAWHTPDSKLEMTKILSRYPETYISVLYDEKRVTVTTSKSTMPSLLQQLRATGITTVDIGIRGRFHTKNHRHEVEELIRFCDSQPAYQLADASGLLIPTRTDCGGEYIKSGSLHHIALKAILLQQSQWHKTFAEVLSSRLADKGSFLVYFGLDNCIPPSLIRTLGSRLINAADNKKLATEVTTDTPESNPRLYNERVVLENDIAVIGMACKVPGADDLEEFWKVLCEGKSQHVEVGDRFSFETTWREDDPKRKWFGNFVNDRDAFDQRFFKKPPRELASMDPQQRLMLQTAYQAVEQSGYFHFPDRDKHIGVYIGVSNVDYQDNIACYPPNAFSATGTLMSFVAGKISHYFGWTGPSLSIDTACSGSAVAVHHACKAILSGDCVTAIAGGVNVITSPLWFQNLAGASFLSTTGPCKPFDAKADGYCRGEACGAVYLKKLSAAVSDGDQILGVITSTAVQQNQNCTPITVPNAISLSNLFEKVIQQAQLHPREVTVVEAHGTGTAVGDPAEYESLRRVFGGVRSRTLSLGSVKGLVGHAECASGIVALIKVLLMIHEGIIPPQASFDTINPAIEKLPTDNIEISTTLKTWDTDFRAAVINNYGASGSNASMSVIQAPKAHTKGTKDSPMQSKTKYPIWFSGFDDQSLRLYSSKLLLFLKSKVVSSKDVSIANLSFNVFRQSNRTLNRALIFSCSSISELENKLTAFTDGQDKSISTTGSQLSRPVILCFGGQVSTFIGLNRQLYDSVNILRRYLDQCDTICKSIGIDGIYPEIFQRSPIADTVKLQTALFAIQYSCAKTWIDCGVHVSALIGHSFGELSALCLSGALSLDDAIKMITCRASIIRDSWGSEKGSMMAIEANLDEVEKVLAESSQICNGEQTATVACFNGPRSFTLAGSVRSIEAVAKTLADHPNPALSSIRWKKLNVTNAFHSTLVDPLMNDLKQVGHDLTFKESMIPLERATESEFAPKLNASFVAEHMRLPVYFNHAVQRLSRKYPSSIWLEAGSNSTITTMASRALGSPSTSHFQAINITSDNSLQSLTDATTSLWKQGLNVTFWAHHSSQTSQYAPLLLPPYQFEKTKHWVDLKVPPKTYADSVPESAKNDVSTSLWTFVKYHDREKRSARFRVNTGLKKYEEYVSGHTVAHAAPLCPSTLQLDMVIEALKSLRPDFSSSNIQPHLHGLENHAPLCMDSSRSVWIDVEAKDEYFHFWNWKMISDAGQEGLKTTLHVSGAIIFRSEEDALIDFAKYERLVGHDRCLRLLNGTDADEIMQGRNIYKAFADVVDYGEVYRGVRKIMGKNMESAGHVVKAYSRETWLDTPLCDSFCQVAGIFVNCMTDRPDKDVCISNKIEGLIRSPKVHEGDSLPEAFDVFATHNHPSDKSWISDVFVFDPRNGNLLGVILGIHYQRVSKAALGKVLSRLNTEAPSNEVAASKTEEVDVIKNNEASTPQDITERVRDLLANVLGLEASEIKDDTALVDIGIDSLLGMELAREIETAFKCTLDTNDLMLLTDFRSLIKCIQSTFETPSEEDTQDTPASGSDDCASQNGGMYPVASTPDTQKKNLETGQARDLKISQPLDIAARQVLIDDYVRKYSQGFSAPIRSEKIDSLGSLDQCVLLTGATGSLGSHLVANLALLPNVKTVICLNRFSSTDPNLRQQQAMESRGMWLDKNALLKLKVFETDTSKPNLGLPDDDYDVLVDTVTHIIHNAWPMTIKRPLHGFESQFQAMRNLVDFAREISCRRPQGSKLGFQFISSIATVGLQPVWSGQALVPEEMATLKSVLPSGYADGKLVCVKILHETLTNFPNYFRPMVARIGQISGSRISGYWNTAEHLSFMIKSSQILKVLPDFQGELSWLPVDDVAATLSELLLSDNTPYPFYHIENPVRQSWSEVIKLLASELDIQPKNIVPFDDWLEKVRDFPGSDADNPARNILDFFDDHFLRMACGGLILDTNRSREHSRTLENATPVGSELLKKYVQAWKRAGFLNQ